MKSSKENSAQEQDKKSAYVSSTEVKGHNSAQYSGISRGKSPSSVQEIPQQKTKQHTSQTAGSYGSPNTTSKEYSSKKPPPPSHGPALFGILPASLSKFFNSGEHKERTPSEKKHNSERRHSEPTSHSSKETNPTIGKSTSYPDQIPRETKDTTNYGSNKTKKEQGNVVSNQIQMVPKEENYETFETKLNDVEGGGATGDVSTNSGRPSRSNSLPPGSDPFFPPKPQSKGLTASRSIDEFLNKIARPRGHSFSEGRKSFDSSHASQHMNRSSSENTSSSRSRSPSVIGNLLNRSGSKDSRIVVPATGARQLRPHEISRQKYLECLRNKLVPTEFVYTGQASEVLLMGDWLEWDSIPLDWEEERGCFRVVVDLPVGDHEFRYIVTPKQENLKEKGQSGDELQA
ncbi:hypothetical protein GpartN1_g5554.t1 [Galdieria partita]|uniref:AMP-activated protein kinase glycogen-binding domain-containing protein n=1 Tax=Galdieria partita TaxID=83374 RepID=A0A9C7USG1_9RHOD|nr:hypothetical protein GpartN1_g5554.t1 [Galdieria partita]